MQRSAALDVLRGTAVILVLFRHGTLDNVLHRIGWIGVDLFFVLSGYLVAAIVFREYLAAGRFNFRRFFWRRGLKIYPAFYFFLIVSLLVNYFEHHISYEPRLILAEVFFLQSYLPHVWTHTWSVAVEEHFYLALTFCSALWLRAKRNISLPTLLVFLAVVLAAVFCLRVLKCYPKRHLEEFSFFSTHLRMDGIVVGVIVAVLKYFTQAWQRIVTYKWLWAVASLMLVWPPFVLPASGYTMNTIGLTIMNLGLGFMLLFILSNAEANFELHRVVCLLAKPIAWIGTYSYSIYLWHLLVLQECQLIAVQDDVRNLIYLLLSVFIGVFFSLLIERPALKLRERFFPGS
jgi:peptidoglycan/LPS O-acetylase OafA/YrhL